MNSHFWSPTLKFLGNNHKSLWSNIPWCSEVSRHSRFVFFCRGTVQTREMSWSCQMWGQRNRSLWLSCHPRAFWTAFQLHSSRQRGNRLAALLLAAFGHSALHLLALTRLRQHRLTWERASYPAWKMEEWKALEFCSFGGSANTLHTDASGTEGCFQTGLLQLQGTAGEKPCSCNQTSKWSFQ